MACPWALGDLQPGHGHLQGGGPCGVLTEASGLAHSSRPRCSPAVLKTWCLSPRLQPDTLSQLQGAPSLTNGSGTGGPGHSPQAPHQPGKLEKAGVRREAELPVRQGQLAVLEGVVGDGDAQGSVERGQPSAPASGSLLSRSGAGIQAGVTLAGR